MGPRAYQSRGGRSSTPEARPLHPCWRRTEPRCRARGGRCGTTPSPPDADLACSQGPCTITYSDTDSTTALYSVQTTAYCDAPRLWVWVRPWLWAWAYQNPWPWQGKWMQSGTLLRKDNRATGAQPKHYRRMLSSSKAALRTRTPGLGPGSGSTQGLC